MHIMKLNINGGVTEIYSDFFSHLLQHLGPIKTRTISGYNRTLSPHDPNKSKTIESYNHFMSNTLRLPVNISCTKKKINVLFSVVVEVF